MGGRRGGGKGGGRLDRPCRSASTRETQKVSGPEETAEVEAAAQRSVAQLATSTRNDAAHR